MRMNLRHAAQAMGASCGQGIPDVVVTGISFDSRKTCSGDLFFCLSGARTDGHDHAGQALERAQLFQETQLRATRDQLAREVVENIRSAVTMEDAVRRAIREMGRTLGASEVVARIGPESELLSEMGGDGHE